MLSTGLIIAALLAAQAAPATNVAPVNVLGARLESGANTRASDPQQEVICRDRPITGSRFNHRRCRTRNQAQTARNQAQNFVTEARVGIAPPPEPGMPR